MAVFKDGNTEESNKMILDGRVDYTVPANYSKGSELEKIVFAVINQIAACDYTIDLHLQHQEKAKAGWNQKNKTE